MRSLLVLASASPRRRELLGRLGHPFITRPVAVDEHQRPGEAPESYALRLAEEKARAVASQLSEGLVIGADTIVVVDGQVLGKPANAAQARQFLRRLRGRHHRVATAVAVVDAATGRSASDICWSEVWLRQFSDAEMEAYIARGDPFDKAGAYAIQDPTFRPVARFEGSRTNIIGLPVKLVARLLEQLCRPIH